METFQNNSELKNKRQHIFVYPQKGKEKKKASGRTLKSQALEAELVKQVDLKGMAQAVLDSNGIYNMQLYRNSNRACNRACNYIQTMEFMVNCPSLGLLNG